MTVDRFSIQVFETVTSTNDTVLQAGADGAPEGTTHLALAQTKGRGRSHRVWWSPGGAGLWMSTLLRPTGRRAVWGGISLLAGAAAQQALTKLDVRNVEVFWPNDLMVRSRKLGGILSEVRSRGDRSWIALGIGINIDLTSPEVISAMPEELRGRITSMVAAGPPTTTDPVAIAHAVLKEFWPLYRRFLAGDPIADLVGEDLACPGTKVEILGSRPRTATVLGLGAAGELLVRDGDGKVESLVAGEVRYEPG